MVPADDHLQEAGPQFDKCYEKCIIVRKVIVMLIVMTLLDKLIMTFIIITLPKGAIMLHFETHYNEIKWF